MSPRLSWRPSGLPSKSWIAKNAYDPTPGIHFGYVRISPKPEEAAGLTGVFTVHHMTPANTSWQCVLHRVFTEHVNGRYPELQDHMAIKPAEFERGFVAGGYQNLGLLGSPEATWHPTRRNKAMCWPSSPRRKTGLGEVPMMMHKRNAR